MRVVAVKGDCRPEALSASFVSFLASAMALGKRRNTAHQRQHFLLARQTGQRNHACEEYGDDKPRNKSSASSHASTAPIRFPRSLTSPLSGAAARQNPNSAATNRQTEIAGQPLNYRSRRHCPVAPSWSCAGGIAARDGAARAGAARFQGHKSYPGIACSVEFLSSLAVNFEPTTRWNDTDMEHRLTLKRWQCPTNFRFLK